MGRKNHSKAKRQGAASAGMSNRLKAHGYIVRVTRDHANQPETRFALKDRVA
jgi:hypothetical protein